MRLRDVGRFACRAPVLFMKKSPQGYENLEGLINRCLTITYGRRLQERAQPASYGS